MGIDDGRVCMVPCTWVDRSGMSTRALEGALDNYACAEIGIKGNSTSL